MRPTVISLAILAAACGPEPSPAPLGPAEIDALPDRVQRLRALERAVFEGAWDLEQMDRACQTLRDSAVREACLRYLGRPHLFRGKALDRALERVPPSASCRGGPASSLDDALDRQGGGEPGCACLPPALAQDECWFRYAEALRATRSLDAAPQATEACHQAGVLKGPCLHHQAEYLGGRCFPQDDTGFEQWAALTTAAEALERSVHYWDETERRRLVDVVWAGALRCAFQRGAAYDSALRDALPEVALPHLRAALAWHLVASTPPMDAELGVLTEAMRRWEMEGKAPELRSDVTLPAGPEEGWVHDAAAWCQRGGAGCQAQPTVRYFAFGKRLLARDAAVDRQLCLLEAAARLWEPGEAGVLDAASRAEAGPVRWTAAHLQGE